MASGIPSELVSVTRADAIAGSTLRRLVSLPIQTDMETSGSRTRDWSAVRQPAAIQDLSEEIIGRRIRAAWIDLGVLLILFIVLSVVTGSSHAGSSTTNAYGTTVHSAGASFSLTGVPFIIFLALNFLYYLVLEALSGQTIRKRIMGLQVVTVDGRAPTLPEILIRTAGRIIDILPAFYLVGWIALKQRRHPRQRLGDRLANTTVIPV
jgi:uncharacterized RDD family membrane protein YckC